jgi:hypothetical protein
MNVMKTLTTLTPYSTTSMNLFIISNWAYDIFCLGGGGGGRGGMGEGGEIHLSFLSLQ